jgi:hypothetical protein
VTVFEEEGDCIVCLEMRADELMRRLISGELTNYSVVRTSPEPLHISPCEKHHDMHVVIRVDVGETAAQSVRTD